MLLCFDLDGTLEDSRADMVAAIQQVRSDLNLEARSDEALVPWVSKGMPKLYANGFDDVDETLRLEIPTRYAYAYEKIIVQQTRLYDGVYTMLEALNSVVPMVVVTNKPERLSRLLLEKLGVLKYFKTVIGGDTFAFAKPNPGMLQGALEISGVEGPCVMVGDSAGDVRMSQSYGATSIWCAWGYYEWLDDVQPDLIVQSPSEVVAFVEALIAKG